MRFDEDELLLIEEAKKHSTLKFPGKPEDEPNAINRLICVCRNLAKSAFSGTEKSNFIDSEKQNHQPRFR